MTVLNEAWKIAMGLILRLICGQRDLRQTYKQGKPLSWNFLRTMRHASGAILRCAFPGSRTRLQRTPLACIRTLIAVHLQARRLANRITLPSHSARDVRAGHFTYCRGVTLHLACSRPGNNRQSSSLEPRTTKTRRFPVLRTTLYHVICERYQRRTVFQSWCFP
jgi:hypothetical protein